MSRQDVQRTTRRARRCSERSLFGRWARRLRRTADRDDSRRATVERIVVASLIWVLAVVSTATLATWAIRSAGSKLGATNTLVPSEVDTSPAPAQGQVSELPAGEVAAGSGPSIAAPTAGSSSTGSTRPDASDRSSGSGVRVGSASASTPAAGSAPGAATTQATTTTSAVAPPAPDPDPVPTSRTSSRSAIANTLTATPTPNDSPSPDTAVTPVTKVVRTSGGDLTATCTDTQLTFTADPDSGWAALPATSEPGEVGTGFRRRDRTVAVLISCVEGSPVFTASG